MEFEAEHNLSADAPIQTWEAGAVDQEWPAESPADRAEPEGWQRDRGWLRAHMSPVQQPVPAAQEVPVPRHDHPQGAREWGHRQHPGASQRGGREVCWRGVHLR